MRTDLSAAELIRTTRLLAKMSQSQLAYLAGVTQSVISLYERGLRQPSLPVLQHLIFATGHELKIEVLPFTDTSPNALSGPIGKKLTLHENRVKQILKSHRVSKASIFGSVARGQDSTQSDIDILIEIPPKMGFFEFSNLKRELENILKTKVDLIPADSLKPSIAKEVEGDLIAL